MGGHLGLVEDDVLVRVQAAGDERRRQLTDVPAQGLRLLRHRDRMHVHDAVKAVVRVLHIDKALDGAEIITEMKIAGGLHAGKDARRAGIGDGLEIGHGIGVPGKRKSRQARIGSGHAPPEAAGRMPEPDRQAGARVGAG